jgi:thiol-disulfide isomerase/thioredoxin
MTTGAWVLIAAVVLAVAYGSWRRVTDGRFRAAEEPSVQPAPEPSVLEGTSFAAHLGERATLVQFSTAFCAPCRVARRTLGEIADVTPGVRHVEIDAEQHLDLVRRVGVMRTPTTLVLDATGREVTRAGGAPTRQQVLQALAGALA